MAIVGGDGAKGRVIDVFFAGLREIKLYLIGSNVKVEDEEFVIVRMNDILAIVD